MQNDGDRDAPPTVQVVHPLKLAATMCLGSGKQRVAVGQRLLRGQVCWQVIGSSDSGGLGPERWGMLLQPLF